MEFKVNIKIRTVICFLSLLTTFVKCVEQDQQDNFQIKNYMDNLLAIATTTQSPVLDKDDEPTR